VKQKFTLFIACFSLLCTPFFAQNNAGCPNANLSMGNFNNWQGFTGNYSNPAAAMGIVNGRHTIMTGAGTDPFSCGGLPIVPPGSTASARLGNSGTGAEGEQLRYTMTVTPQNALFIYKYACVLEDPGHPPNAQPVFQMRLLGPNGNQIGGNCGQYTVYAGQPGQNFQTCGGVKWLPWTIVGINLTAYTGQSVTIEFTTKDCDYSGHFGYAYVVADCMPLILDLDYCFGANVINIAGPAGFQSYSWSSGQNTQAISVPAAQAQPNYTVTMQSFSNQGNCTVSLTAQAIPTTVSNNFTVTQACPWSPTLFTSTPTILPTSINGVQLANGGAASWFWDFGDGSTINGNVAGNGPGAHQHPSHTYANPGTYTVTHIVFTQAGCSDTISQTINVLPPPVINFSFNNACVFDTVNTTNLTNDPNLAAVTYQWIWGDNTPNATTTNAWHVYQNAGTYQLGLAATNIGGCVDTLYQAVTVHPLPPVFAGNDTTICPGFNIPLLATGAVSYVWETGTQNGGSYIPPSSEMITVTGTDGNGCVNSDSLYVTLYPAAVVDAGPDISVCDGSSVTITGSGVANYSWDNGLLDGQTFTPPVGVVTYTVTGTDVNGCIDTDQMLLTVWANPVVSAGNDQIICEGDSTVLSGSGAVSYVWNNGVINNDYFIPLTNNTFTVTGTDINGCVNTDVMVLTIENAAYPSFVSPVLADCIPFTFLLNNTSTGTPFIAAEWSFGNGATATGAGPISYTYNTPGCYDIGLTLTTALGCEWDTTVQNYLCAYPLPIADFEPSPMVITDLENTSTMINQSAGGSYYAWDFGDGTSSTEFEPLHFFPNTTSANYLITLIVYTQYGCTDTTNRVVTLNETQLIYVPNTFTPDGNEYNQTWFPVISADFDPYEYSCFIYDRWGELIWESHNHLVGWDGRRLNGNSIQDGVYTWKIIIKSPYRDERKAFTGHVTLLR
jgi:gliding motility-associated-like protein